MYANPFKRILSFLVDAFVAGIITAYPIQYLRIREGLIFTISTLVIHALSMNFLRIIAVGYWNKTPGMFLLKMRVRSEDDTKLGLKKAFIREFPLLGIMIIEIVVFCLRLIDMNISDINYISAVKSIYPNGKSNWLSYISQIYYLAIFSVMFLNLKRKAIIDYLAKTIVIQE